MRKQLSITISEENWDELHRVRSGKWSASKIIDAALDEMFKKIAANPRAADALRERDRVPYTVRLSELEQGFASLCEEVEAIKSQLEPLL